MLYQMSCGKLPFEGDSMAQLMFRIANEPHPDIRSVNPDLPDCLVAIIDRAMTKDPDARYESCRDFELSGRDHLVRALDAGHRTAHQLRRAQAGDDDELERVGAVRTLNHGAFFFLAAFVRLGLE